MDRVPSGFSFIIVINKMYYQIRSNGSALVDQIFLEVINSELT